MGRLSFPLKTHPVHISIHCIFFCPICQPSRQDPFIALKLFPSNKHRICTEFICHFLLWNNCNHYILIYIAVLQTIQQYYSKWLKSKETRPCRHNGNDISMNSKRLWCLSLVQTNGISTQRKEVGQSAFPRLRSYLQLIPAGKGEDFLQWSVTGNIKYIPR